MVGVPVCDPTAELPLTLLILLLAGLATLVGIITPINAFLGADAAVHMAEELKNASKTLPQVMVWTSIINGVLGFVMLM